MAITCFQIQRSSVLVCLGGLLLGMAFLASGSVVAEAADRYGPGMGYSQYAQVRQVGMTWPASYPCPPYYRSRGYAPYTPYSPYSMPGGMSAQAPGTIQERTAPAPPETGLTQPNDALTPPETPVDLTQTAPQLAPTASPGAAPNMLGDLGMSGGVTFEWEVLTTTRHFTADGEMPAAGASRRVKVAENNSPVVQDRVYCMYSHFHNALDASAQDLNYPDLIPPNSHTFPADRYTIGFEKSFFGPFWSVELRMPFAGQIDYDLAHPSHDGYGTSVSGGEFGNLAISVKRVLYQDAYGALSAGLGIDTPTGTDSTLRWLDFNYRVENEAVHLLPYFGFMGTPNQWCFMQGFVQFDVPLGGNSITYGVTDPVAPRSTEEAVGILDEQNLLYVDVGAGFWLYRNPCAYGLTGLAAIVEFHYTTTLQDTDFVRDSLAYVQFDNPANRMDIPNLTVGLHSEIFGCNLVRVAGVIPLKNGDDRLFDSEIQVQLERRF